MEKFKQRLEFNFKEGMSWENYGSVWEIDHIKPISAFEKDTPPSVVNALCNLQPLLIETNNKKRKTIGHCSNCPPIALPPVVNRSTKVYLQKVQIK